MQRRYETKTFRLGHIFGILLGRELRFDGTIFLLEPVLSFMFGMSVPQRDFPSALSTCRDELRRQFPWFGEAGFLFEVARLAVAVSYLPEGVDSMPVVGHWCREQVSRYGDRFRVRTIRSVFLFLDEAERTTVATKTVGQQWYLN